MKKGEKKKEESVLKDLAIGGTSLGVGYGSKKYLEPKIGKSLFKDSYRYGGIMNECNF